MNMIGKKIAVHFSAQRRQSPSGFHIVQVAKVSQGRMTIKMYNAFSDRWDGRKVRIWHNEWSAPCCGVLYRGKIRPIEI